MRQLSRQYQPGDSIEKWNVLGKLGAGAMGIVYDVEHCITHKPAALKVLKVTGKRGDVLAGKMIQEARMLARQNHPNLVDVFDAGDGSGEHGHFMVMEKLVGCELTDIIEDGPIKLERALRYAEHIASAAACAHAQGVVHRDLKPDNIHVSEKDILKVIDFGAGQFRQGGTMNGVVIGTVPYMSPEQLRSEPLDGRSDIYALGLILHEMVTGRHIYKDNNGDWLPRDQVMRNIGAYDVPLSDFKDVDERVRPLLLRALAKHRNNRYPSMDLFAADLQQLRKSVGRSYAATERLTEAEVARASSSIHTALMTSTEAAAVVKEAGGDAEAATTVPPRWGVPRYYGIVVATVMLVVGIGIALTVAGSGDKAADMDGDLTETTRTAAAAEASGTVPQQARREAPVGDVTAKEPRSDASAVAPEGDGDTAAPSASASAATAKSAPTRGGAGRQPRRATGRPGKAGGKNVAW